MMTGEKLGVGHEPRHGTAYVSSWIKALENDPREIRAAAVDAQRMSDWLLARERDRTPVDDRTDSARPDVGQPPPAQSQRQPVAVPEPSAPGHETPRPEAGLSR